MPSMRLSFVETYSGNTNSMEQTKVVNPQPSTSVLQPDNDTQPCPVCGKQMGIMPGSRDAYCHNCGFKDPCCE
jgi:hypothetical protein